MNVTVDGYDGKGITQCYSCNRFRHTAENCHITPRFLKYGEVHQTRECQIQRVKNRYCINCETYGHRANYTGCPKFPNHVKALKLTTTHTQTLSTAQLDQEFRTHKPQVLLTPKHTTDETT
ncbi:hypothetical protein TNCV_4638801 [Trichonephila clavipes]|uniref:Uncharacterized protein n=1 Tax=Trichonephila clavipes TaxID=2585209 RepID=A0A8X6WE83_TRICX|nr:hypothetical protein TNCV_4638801 [Trichonephila clavipes]